MLTKRYKIVKNTDLESLSGTVNKNIEKGWELVGGPFVIDENIYRYAQAMILEEDGDQLLYG